MKNFKFIMNIINNFLSKFYFLNFRSKEFLKNLYFKGLKIVDFFKKHYVLIFIALLLCCLVCLNIYLFVQIFAINHKLNLVISSLLELDETKKTIIENQVEQGKYIKHIDLRLTEEIKRCRSDVSHDDTNNALYTLYCFLLVLFERHINK